MNDHAVTELTFHEIETLALYNAEVARGIEHTLEWKFQMAELQRRFDIQMVSR